MGRVLRHRSLLTCSARPTLSGRAFCEPFKDCDGDIITSDGDTLSGGTDAQQQQQQHATDLDF
jgi:hypothetical protein